MNQYPNAYMNVPGQYDGEVYETKNILWHADNELDKTWVSIAPFTGDLDVGTILGVSTADSLYRPVRRTTLTAQAAVPTSGAQTLEVEDVTPFKIGDSLTVMEADGTERQQVGAITAINPATKTITVTTNLATAVESGGFVFVADGSEKALVILAQPVPDAAVAKTATVYVGGKFYTDQLIGLDELSLKDLNARQPVPNMTIVPV